jgi:hypothetical protein
MQRTLLTWCWALLGTTIGFSQNGFRPAYPLEIGIQVGTSQFLGDLGGQPGVGQGFIIDTDFSSVRPTFGIFGRYNIGGHFALRLDMNYMQLHGDDKFANNTGGFSGSTPREFIIDASWYRYYRNLNFKSDVFEMQLAAEIIPYNFELGGGYKNYSVISPYGFIGVGFFAFQPKGLYNGSWVELKPLRTEGQGLVDGRAEYQLVQLNIPLGFGVKWMYNDTWALALEINHRMTFTDYIDDVSTFYVEDQSVFDQLGPGESIIANSMSRRSGEIDNGGVNSIVTAPGAQRGDPQDNDSYYTVTVRFSFYLDTQNMGGSRRYGCPVW